MLVPNLRPKVMLHRKPVGMAYTDSIVMMNAEAAGLSLQL
jgi:hypothetical protein